MGKSCGLHDFFSLGGQYYSLGQSNIYQSHGYDTGWHSQNGEKFKIVH